MGKVHNALSCLNGFFGKSNLPRVKNTLHFKQCQIRYLVLTAFMEHIETGLAQMGNDYRMVISSGEQIISITKRQFKFLKDFLATGDFNAAVSKAGVERITAVGWFKDSKFRKFLQERLQYAADRNGCTFDWAISELKNLWNGKRNRNKVQMDAMKEINRMLGFIKENQGGVNAREYINVEYAVIQKDSPINIGLNPPQIPAGGRPIEGQIYLPDVRKAMGKVNPGGMEGSQGDQSTALDGLVSKQSTQTGQGYDLGQDAPNPGAM